MPPCSRLCTALDERARARRRSPRWPSRRSAARSSAGTSSTSASFVGVRRLTWSPGSAWKALERAAGVLEDAARSSLPPPPRDEDDPEHDARAASAAPPPSRSEVSAPRSAAAAVVGRLSGAAAPGRALRRVRDAVFAGHYRRRLVPARSRHPAPSDAVSTVRRPWSYSTLILGLAARRARRLACRGSRRLTPRRARARRRARRARRRAARRFDEKVVHAVRRRLGRGLSGEQLGLPRARRDEADRLRAAAEGVAREGRRPGADARAGARAGLRRARRAGLAARASARRRSQRRCGRRTSAAAGARSSSSASSSSPGMLPYCDFEEQVTARPTTAACGPT